MKLQTNFAFPFDRFIPALTFFLLSVAFLGLLGAVVLTGDALRLYRENPELKITMEALRKNPIETVKLALPSAQEERDLKRRLSALNKLQAGSRSPLFHLARLEGLLPADACLLNFQDDLDTNEIQLVVETMSLEDISRFMAALEKDKTFSKVTLTKQSQSQGTKGNWIQFSLEMAGAS